MSFVNLHAHTEYSISDGLFGVKDWAKALKDRGYIAHAITDHGTLAGAIPFYKAMKEQNLTAILGCEFYYVNDPLDKGADNRKSQHLILLAKNYDGFQNLLKLSRLSYVEGYYYKPRIGLDWIREHREGLVCLTACMGGVLSHEVWREKDGDENAVGLIEKFKIFSEIFGEDFYVEFQGHEGDQANINKEFYNRLRSLKGFKSIITNDCHYINPEHAKVQTMLKQIAMGNSEAGQSYTDFNSLWLKKPDQVFESFRKNHEYLPESFVKDSMAATMEVFEKTRHLKLPENKKYLPKFRKNLDSKEVFLKLTTVLLKKFLESDRLRASKKEYVERFKKEYRVISKHNLEDYFLIVWDLVRFAKSEGIFSGLGRGSAAGSLISYLLGITKIDPLEYKLIFERFLNENRCSVGELPDIDLDFESDQRDVIKDYIFKTYGTENVCEIGTYGRRKLKTCLIDFSKALGIVKNQKEILAITRDIETNDVLEAMDSDIRVKNLISGNMDLAESIVATINGVKSQSIHPAGIIVCSDPVHLITPVKTQKKNDLESKKEGKRVIVTQSEDKHVMAQGLMKLDILGVKEYDIIKYVLKKSGSKLTLENYVQEILEQERREPNQKVWEFFQSGRTEGVFQFESEGMRELLRQMRPDCINDLIAANALFRPGCLKNGWHIQYCNRKHGLERVEYVHDDLKAATGDTYGVIVFQEQFMEVIHRLGGISLIDSDTIRSALGKKDADKLAKFKKQFVSGAALKVGSESAAEGIWNQIEKASGYAFNRSHSAAYSVLAYISQYLKVNHPSEFWAAQLDWDVRKNKHDDLSLHRKAASEQNVEFELPRINRSGLRFEVGKDRKIIWSLCGIKGVADKTAQEIVLKNYDSFRDFYERVHKAKVRINHMENMIYAGVFDCFGDRKEIMRELCELKDRSLPPMDDVSFIMKFKECMGFFEQKIKNVYEGFDKNCITEQILRHYPTKETVTVGGVIEAVKAIKTKNGDPMAFVTISDLDETIEATLFMDAWLANKKELKEGRVAEFFGRKSAFGNKKNAIEVENIKFFS
jgi:DNA polymerase-3 subunit alpha